MSFIGGIGRSGGKPIAGRLAYKGVINLPEEFPAPVAVVFGDYYVIGTDVIDNDPVRTNTDLQFYKGDVIVWDGSTWVRSSIDLFVEDSVTGKITQRNIDQDLDLKEGNFKSNESETTLTEVVDLGDTVIRNDTVSDLHSHQKLHKGIIMSNLKIKKADYTFQPDDYGILADTTQYAVTSVTRVDSTATVTTSSPHNLSVGEYAFLEGADQSEYNVIHEVLSVLSPTQYTFAVSGTPATPATGTITLGGEFDLYLLLSTSVDVGTIKFVKNIGNNQVDVNCSGSDTVDGSSYVPLYPDGDSEFLNGGNEKWYTKGY